MSNQLEYTAAVTGFDKVDRALQSQAKNLQQTATAAVKYDNSIKALKPGTNEATRSLVDLGRVVQDAPFGFIGIANNLNPLLEGFSRLKTETGSTKGALSALASSLVGGGGLGLALSLVTSAVSFATIGFGSWTRGLSGTQEAAKKTKDAIDTIIQSLAEEQVKVDIIVQQIKTENLTRNQRVEAIRRLQQIAPEYFSTLNKEKATIEDITQAYDRFSKSILASIETRVREKELITITEQILKLQEKGRDVGKDQIVVDGKLQTVNNARLQTLDEANKKINVYKQFQEGVLGLTLQEQDELENLLRTRQKLIELIASQKGAETFNVVQPKIKLAKIEIDEPKLLKGIRELPLFKNPITVPGATIEVPVAANVDAGDLPKRVIDFTEELNAFFQDSARQIAVGFGEELAKTISGQGNLGDFFAGIAKSLARGVKELGKQLIQYAIQIKIIKSTLFKNPTVALAAGIALVAFGSLFEAQFNKQAFATGTRFAPGGLALVGERGPELMQVPRGAQITPAAQTANLLGGMGGAFIAETRVAGSDLLLVLKRAEKSYSRTA